MTGATAARHRRFAVRELAGRAWLHEAPGRFLLTVNGIARAWTDPHGAAMEANAPAPG